MAKRSTLRDVAALAAVSRSAVARVLLGTGGDHVRIAPATRDRIEKAALRLNYSPNRSAQQLRGVSSRMLGLIIETENLPVMSARLFSLEHEAARQGYRLLIGRTHGETAQLNDYLADFTGRGAEAIFCLFDLKPGRDERVKKIFAGFKSVVFHGRPAWERGYCVKTDTAAAIRASVDHLVARGKRRIGLALWNVPRDELMRTRKESFIAAVAAHKIRSPEKLVWDAASVSVEPSAEILDHGMETMVKRHGADAIIASNDIWAARFIIRLKEMGMRIPEDIAVVGYDNLDIGAVLTPSLTTIDQCHEAYAAAAIGLLVRLARGGRIALRERTVAIPPRLVVRNSS
ncbi:MAG TPA: LacI family DNA-binding transcriptional regulator [Chthoniobacteraceae bacterium]|jgi:DNA-binding LacI/PurR family transcriptional regulator|nr:LacI family DNA-binding transcriptional regulator [Chthoniobacteraceae bacterium]